MRQVRVRKKPAPDSREMALLKTIAEQEKKIEELKESLYSMKMELADSVDELSRRRGQNRNRGTGALDAEIAYDLVDKYITQGAVEHSPQIYSIVGNLDKCHLRVAEMELTVESEHSSIDLNTMEGGYHRIRVPDQSRHYTLRMEVEVTL